LLTIRRCFAGIVSESGDGDGSDVVEEEPNPLQRALDLLVFAPVGIALSVAEDLPGLIGKGQQRIETDVQNARIVGRIVVAQSQRQLVERISKLLHRAASDETDDASDATESTGGADATADATTTPSARPAPSPKPTADPADALIVESALAGYDTLSASQVVRRLEGLGPDELRALNRHEASHRNRHTILNRAHQILEQIEADNAADPSDPAASAFAAPQSATAETAAQQASPSESDAPGVATEGGTLGAATVAPEAVTPEAPTSPTSPTSPVTPPTPATPATPPPVATAPEPDLPHE
jgi:hypothetical protein